MMVKLTIKTKGIDQAMQKINALSNKVRQLDGPHKVSINELFPPSFITEHTKFSDVGSMFEASGFNISTHEELSEIPNVELDRFIASSSTFRTWEDMRASAIKVWISKKLDC